MFYKLNNLASFAVTKVEEPWLLPPTQYPEDVKDKQSFINWQNRLTTDGCFLSMAEGAEPAKRISQKKSNPVRRMYGLIADYDAPLNDDGAARYVNNPPTEYYPMWRVETYSGHSRAVWGFEEPSWVNGQAHVQEYLNLIMKEIDVPSWLPGFDKSAFMDISHFYELGRRWIPWKPDYRIPKAFTRGWLYESSRHIVMVPEYRDFKIPINEIAEEVEARWPGKWKGPFEIGQRGIRFWAPDADNETGAYIMEHGVMAFSGEQRFLPWGEILGQAFVERFKMDKLSIVTGKMATDGKKYWMLYDDDTGWKSLPETTLIRHLKVAGFNPRPPKGGVSSEIDHAITCVDKTCRVERALPFVHKPTGIISWEGKRYLNTATARCMASADLPGITEAADVLPLFPFIWSLLKSLFVDKSLTDRNIQMNVFLAWIKRFYENGKAYSPNQGQLIVLAGPREAGKTLLTNRVIAPLVGGSYDASGYFIKENRFTAAMLHMPLMTLDDPEPVQTMAASMAFTARLKRVVACPRMIYDEKYLLSGEVEYYGRIILIANMDGNSRQAIPEIDTSMQDKIILLNCSPSSIKFAENTILEATIARELPYFARFLELWTPPEKVMSKRARFGVVSYKHPGLYKDVMATEASSFMQEILQDFLNAYADANPGKKCWEGKSTNLYEELTVFKPATMKNLSAQAFASKLWTLTRKPFFNISYTTDPRTHSRTYKIDFDLMTGGADLEYDEEKEFRQHFRSMDLYGTVLKTEEKGENDAGTGSKELASVRTAEGKGIQQGKCCKDHERELGEAPREEKKTGEAAPEDNKGKAS